MSDPNPVETHDDTPTMDGIDRGRAWLVGVAVGLLMLVGLVVAFVAGTNFSDDPTTPVAGAETTQSVPQEVSAEGRQAFITKCGSCHTMGEAGTSGTIGPNLDTLKPAAAVVEQAIVNGGTGTGAMPPGLATGPELTQIVEYVVAASGGG